MISILDALEWLNWGRKTELPDNTRFWINQLENLDLTNSEKKSIIESLIGSLGRIKKVAEMAEVLVYCAAYGYRLNMVEDALKWLDQTDNLYDYTGDYHRQAVTHWMRFTVKRALGRYESAFNHARRARRIFTEMAEQCRARAQASAESWYSGRIQDMTCDLISAPEDMFEWMYEFHGSFLSPSAAQLKDRLAEYLGKRSFEKTDESMQLLLGISLKSYDPKESGEALAYCGVIHWVLENQTEAIQFFHSAMTQFVPRTHEYALLSWMLGLALFGKSADRGRAITHMEDSIEAFEELRKASIYKNQIDRRDWYAIHHIVMKRVLRLKISSII